MDRKLVSVDADENSPSAELRQLDERLQSEMDRNAAERATTVAELSSQRELVEGRDEADEVTLVAVVPDSDDR